MKAFIALVAGVAVLLVALPACSRTGSEAVADPPLRTGSEAVADPRTMDEIEAQLDQINADTKGFDALRVRAEQGDAEAQLLLGLAYGRGEGVPEDYAEAERLVRLAAEQGFAWAQASLGEMYEIGLGVPQDNVSAHMWFNLAAAQSTGENREWSAAARDAVAARMTREDLSEAQRRGA